MKRTRRRPPPPGTPAHVLRAANEVQDAGLATFLPFVESRRRCGCDFLVGLADGETYLRVTVEPKVARRE